MSEDSKRISDAQARRVLMRMDDRAARRRAGISAAVILAVAVVMGALATRFLFTAAAIRTDGMTDVLMGGDVALCVRSDSELWPQEIERGALVLVRYEDSGLKRVTVRRVIGLGGDEIEVDDEGHVTLNGEALDEPYATYSSLDDWTGDATPGGALENPFAQPGDPVEVAASLVVTAAGMNDVEYPLTVPEGAAFVLCDNRDNRLDSRSSRFGLVPEIEIKGVARAIIWPVYRVGLLGDAPIVG